MVVGGSRDTHPEHSMDVNKLVKALLDQRSLTSDAAASIDDDLPLDQIEGFGQEELIDLVELLEDAFHIAIEDEEILEQNLGTIELIARFVSTKRAAGAGHAQFRDPLTSQETSASSADPPVRVYRASISS